MNIYDLLLDGKTYIGEISGSVVSERDLLNIDGVVHIVTYTGDGYANVKLPSPKKALPPRKNRFIYDVLTMEDGDYVEIGKMNLENYSKGGLVNVKGVSFEVRSIVPSKKMIIVSKAKFIELEEE